MLSTAILTQAFLRHRRSIKLQERSSTSPQQSQLDKPAAVITINTMGAYALLAPKVAAYGASKAAAARLMELLTADVSAAEARFFSVHPGAVRTEMYDKSGMDGQFEVTDGRLTGEFVVWLATEQAAFLNGRFVWVNWDVDELVGLKEEIMKKGLLMTAIKEGEF